MIWSLRHGAFAASASLLLASCGGGGGGGGDSSGGNNGNTNTNTSSPLQVAFNTNALTFSATAPFDVIEISKRVNGTVTPTGNGTASGTLYVVIEVPANSFFTVPEAQIDTSDSGHATVQVASPQQMGPGTFDGSFRIRLCLNSQSCSGNSEIRGSPHTVTVHYTVGDVLDADTVTPNTVLSGAPGSVILRGHGFTASTTVSLGGTAATSVTYVNPTELRLQYPALSSGSYPVTLNSGATTFDGALVAVAATNYGYSWVPHQSSPWFVSALIYDAEHGAFVYSVHGSGQAQLLRYQFSGGNWVPAGDTDGMYITQLRMSHDGANILALRAEQYVSAKLLDLDPITLAITRETSIDSGTWSFAVSNDGNYIFTKRFPGTGGFIPPDVFGSNDRTAIVVNRINFHSLESIASGDGSRVVIFGDSGSVGTYDTSTFAWTSVNSNGLAGAWNYPHTASANVTGTRFASMGVVVDQNMQPIGQAPVSPQNSILSADGSRLYVYDQGDLSPGVPTGRLRTYDVNAATSLPANTQYPVLAEIGTPIVLANNPNGVYTTESPAAMALTLDGRAVIICGVAGCVVQPTPP